jgi:small-conductance mechanosensitive channel
LSITSLFRTEMAAAMVAAAVLGLILLALRPQDRAATRNSLILLGFCAALQIVEHFTGSVGSRGLSAILADIASILIGVVLIRQVTIFVFRVALPKVGAATARIAEDLATAALIVGWGLVWLRLSGVDLASLVTTSAVITGILAFSMQETLGNVFGGVVLQLDHSIRVGDWVRVDDLSGRVAEIRWRHTAVVTRNGETVVIPNSHLMKNRFVVIGDRRAQQTVWRRWIRLNVDFATPPSEVIRVLEESVRNAEIAHVAESPAPNAVLMEIGPRYGGYALRYWLDDPLPDDTTDSRVRLHVLAALERRGIKLGAPFQEELAIRDDEFHREAARKAERLRRLSALAAVELFAHLSEDERETLAEHLVRAPFVAGDVITRQGAVAHWLYLIISGTAEVWLETAGGRQRVSSLGAGDIFGEMGMMTGEPRRATVTARTDVECYRLDKAGFESVLRARPDIATRVSGTLAARAVELEGLLGTAAAAERTRAHRDDILARIRSFFALE